MYEANDSDLKTYEYGKQQERLHADRDIYAMVILFLIHVNLICHIHRMQENKKNRSSWVKMNCL